MGFLLNSSAVASNNRAYNNSDSGFAVYNSATASGNRSYSNAIGIRLGDAFSGASGP